jgi:hypothetical protein
MRTIDRSKFGTCTKFSMCTHILNVYTRTCVHTHTSLSNVGKHEDTHVLGRIPIS